MALKHFKILTYIYYSSYLFFFVDINISNTLKKKIHSVKIPLLSFKVFFKYFPKIIQICQEIKNKIIVGGILIVQVNLCKTQRQYPESKST